MRSLLAFTLLDLRHIMRDRSSLLWMVVMPFVFMAFFGKVFSAAAPGPPQVQAVALHLDDQDQTDLSRGLVAAFDTTRFAWQETSEGATRSLILPAGLEDSLRAGAETKIRLVRHGGSEERLLAAEAGAVRALVKVHGALALAGPDSTAWPDENRAAFRAALDESSLVRVHSQWTGAPRPPSGFGQSVPGNLVTFVLMSTVLQAAILLATEKSNGSLRRVLAQPVSYLQVLLGKTISRFLLSFAQVCLLLIGARFLFGYQAGPNLPAFLAVCAAFVLTAVGLGLFLGVLAPSVQRAAMVGWIGVLMMAAIGGAWWPLELVQGPLRAVAFAFPTAWAMHGLQTVTLLDGGFAEVARPVFVLLAMGCALVLAGAWRLRASTQG